ncbi:UNVERIFIED_CONTAM: hypothetical protein K2H54_039813 [Gekko kuhli]
MQKSHILPVVPALKHSSLDWSHVILMTFRSGRELYSGFQSSEGSTFPKVRGLNVVPTDISETVNTTVGIRSKKASYPMGEYIVILKGYSGHFEADLFLCMNFTLILKKEP